MIDLFNANENENGNKAAATPDNSEKKRKTKTAAKEKLGTSYRKKKNNRNELSHRGKSCCGEWNINYMICLSCPKGVGVVRLGEALWIMETIIPGNSIRKRGIFSCLECSFD